MYALTPTSVHFKKKKKNANFGFVRVVLAILFVSLSTIVLLVCKLNRLNWRSGLPFTGRSFKGSVLQIRLV